VLSITLHLQEHASWQGPALGQFIQFYIYEEIYPVVLTIGCIRPLRAMLIILMKSLVSLDSSPSATLFEVAREKVIMQLL